MQPDRKAQTKHIFITEVCWCCFMPCFCVGCAYAKQLVNTDSIDGPGKNIHIQTHTCKPSSAYRLHTEPETYSDGMLVRITTFLYFSLSLLLSFASHSNAQTFKTFRACVRAKRNRIIIIIIIIFINSQTGFSHRTRWIVLGRWWLRWVPLCACENVYVAIGCLFK